MFFGFLLRFSVPLSSFVKTNFSLCSHDLHFIQFTVLWLVYRTFWQVYWESASRSQNKNKFISLADKKYLIYLCHTSNKPGRLPEKPIKRDKRQAAGIVQIVKVFQCTHSLRALQPDSAVETRDFAEDKYSTRKSPV